ncbi:DoxX family protein [Paenibacillus sp. N3.4]|uniref:DoxX family protein n=1 Tax=Paenibacillus sp. N3.4 TaxID=2603222 RepID=UPI0011C99FFF|nr:DoxX family protein [Paenibacillus sp. N3.4]TXK84449.1 DoxX family protein [Paenibacillus sp. N3.4]
MDILVFILQGLLALMFLMAGVGKITGSKMHIEGFKRWGLPQWFRVVTGIIEFVAAAALIIGYWAYSWAAVGAILLGITAIGGILVHVRMKDSFKDTFMIVILGILSFIVFFIRLSDLSAPWF